MAMSGLKTACIAVTAAALGAGVAYVILSRQLRTEALQAAPTPRKSEGGTSATPTKRKTAATEDVQTIEQVLRASWAKDGARFCEWWGAATDDSKLALLKSARELVRQRLAEQGAAAALEALCPELAERLLPRLLPDDTVPRLLEARVSEPEAARELDAGFLRASWGAVPSGLVSPIRSAPRPGARAPPPASPAAFAAQLSKLVQAGEWDVADVLTDNRGILIATFWADVLLLSRAVASGVEGRIAAALSQAEPAAPTAPAPEDLVLEPRSPKAVSKETADVAQPTRTKGRDAPEAASHVAEPAPPAPWVDGAAEDSGAEELDELADLRAGVADRSDAASVRSTPAPSETDGESTPEPEEAEEAEE